ncbi:hypothetical protein RF11_03586 [Thelohanellus kitauei]|uniref:Reverse transcriptase/retrotransposon-derived protein RNase H-like domain-containing protein n=1 Tax=Thelohanellus kitauei TaxID=669202 RepID=A0A0C2IN76_THEKT|nr:hypothetical protein RF11_03586 [Thelohanellus kitauei]
MSMKLLSEVYKVFFPSLRTTLPNDKSSKFSMDTTCDNSFSTLKNAFLNIPTLLFPDHDLPIILEKDASKVVLGVKFGKEISNKNCQNIFALRLLRRSEKGLLVSRQGN